MELARRRLRGRAQELDEELVCPELGRLHEPGEVGGEAGLALGDERVVEPRGRNEGRCQDPFGWERAWVIEGIMQRDELHGTEVSGLRMYAQ